VDRLSLERLAHHAQQVPLPGATQQRLGQVLPLLPARSLALIAPTRGEQMQMGMVVAVSSMRGEHRAVPSPQRLAPEVAREILEAWPPAAPERTSYARRVLGEGRAAQRWDRQADVPLDHPRLEGLTHLVAPGVHGALGAPQA
jgi:hypothetical protein